MTTLPFFAHAFGQTYTLPIPFWLFLFAAASVVILSFVIIALLFGERTQEESKRSGLDKNLGVVASIGKAIGVFALILTIVAGVGNIGALSFSITFFWVIFLLGFTYITAIFGNLWSFMNPFRALFEFAEALFNKRHKPLLQYPRWLSYYPALLTFFGIIWLELLSYGFSADADRLARLLLAYTAATLLYAYVFGKDAWFKYGEFFSVFFSLVSKVSPIKIASNRITYRKPFSGLLEGDAKNPSLLIFILFMLSSTGFDGFRETTPFRQVADWLPDFMTKNYQLYQTVFLALTPFILLAIYLLFIALMKKAINSKTSVWGLGLKFSFSLIPIAVAYSAAHYFPLLWVQGPSIFQYISDPLELGWNLFGTADSSIGPGPLSAFTVWYGQVFLIIAGHVAAIYGAHRIAIKTFESQQQAVTSQFPMLILMIIYTVGSLWVIGQPLAL